MWKAITAFVILVAGLILATLGFYKNLSNVTVPVEYPNFEAENKLFIVNGASGKINEVALDVFPLRRSTTLSLDIDLYLYSIDTDGEYLFVGGVTTDPENETANGVYRVHSQNGKTELLYDSGDDAVVKVFCITKNGQFLVAAIQQDEIVLVDPVGKEVVQRISYDFRADYWSLVDEKKIVGFSGADSTLFAIDVSIIGQGFDVITDVSNMLSLRSRDLLPYKQGGVWYEYSKENIQQTLSEEWVEHNAKHAKLWPSRAVEDVDGNLIQLFGRESKGDTRFIYRGHEIGTVNGSVYDMCVY